MARSLERGLYSGRWPTSKSAYGGRQVAWVLSWDFGLVELLEGSS